MTSAAAAASSGSPAGRASHTRAQCAGGSDVATPRHTPASSTHHTTQR